MARKGTTRKAKRGSMKERVKKRAQEREQQSTGWINLGDDDAEFFSHTKGRNIIDIIPYEVTVDTHPEVEAGQLWYQRTAWVHYDIGMEERTVVCPLKTIKQPCPICEARADLIKEDGDEELIEDLRPRERELFNVRVDGEIMLWTLSYHLFGKQLEEEIRDDEEYAGFADLEDGYTLKVRFKKEKLGSNSFLKASRIDFESRDDLKEKILDDVYNLDEIIVILSYEELENLYYELEGDEEGGEEPEPETKPRPPRRPQKQEEEEEPEPEEGEEPEPESEPEEKEPEQEEEQGGSSEGECPHEFNFGEDCNKYDECEDCGDWNECQDRQDALEDEKKADKKPAPKKPAKGSSGGRRKPRPKKKK